MNKNNIKNSLLILGTAFTFISFQNYIVKAADTTTSNAQTKATLTFRQPGPTDTTPPADPSNPSNPSTSNPIDAGDPNNSGTHSGGPLSIDYAPNFDFGIGTISSQNKMYNLSDATYSDGKTRQHNPFVQISDNRGSRDGWNLSASISDFTNTAGSTSNTLKGAQVSIKSKDSSPIVAFNGTGETPSLNSNQITLSNSSQNLMTASQGQGTGTWLERFDPQQVTLSVPGGSAQTGIQYNANITWNLTASPK